MFMDKLLNMWIGTIILEMILLRLEEDFFFLSKFAFSNK